MRPKYTSTRRAFLKHTAAAVAAPMIVPASALGRGGRAAPSERIVVGAIGAGDRGRYILGAALAQRDTQVIAVCDVKRACRDKAAAMVHSRYENEACAAYNDFRELLNHDDIDACLVGSCDHWHVPHALAAVRAGKDVFVEKPLGLTVEQDQVLRAAVKEHGAVFQLGTQQRSYEDFHRACELVRNGRIGTVREIRVWAPPSICGGPTEEVPVPDGLDYDLWLGPAPYHPYTKDRVSHDWWWFISDYALGFIAGWGIHPLDIALWGAGDRAAAPVTVSGEGVFPAGGLCNTATEWDVHFTYENGLAMRFHSDPPPEEWATRYGEITGHGTVFEGDDGWILVDRRRLRVEPAALGKEPLGEGAVRLYESRNHMRNFFDCVRNRAATVSNIDVAVASDIGCHIADIAIRLERPLHWDTQTERFPHDDEANARLSRPMREPWTLLPG